MKLKAYQQEAMESVSRYFTACVKQSSAEAFEQMQPDFAYKIPSPHENLKAIPYVCVRIPTGGGKTLLAAHSIAQVAKDYLHQDFPITLWLVPSKTIKSQTAEALKNPKHPYRVVLDKTFNREVLVIESEQFELIRPQDLGNKAIVVVSTLQNFRIEKEKDEGRKIYAFNEKLTPHFERIPAQLLPFLDKVSTSDLQENGLQTKQLGQVKCSFANLLKAYRPLIIVDEAHNARTSLTFDVFANLMPSAILEFTATPNQDKKTGSNILYHVSAGALKEEEMIKLPIMLREHKTWQQAIDRAVIERGALAQKAQNELDYIRPIVLFQAEPKSQTRETITVDVLKKYLVETLHIDEKEIAVVTGEQHELDNVNIADKSCPINYVITIEALKEGWDCPFAYVFCSVQNVGSSKEAEQLLGRVLRMPYAKRRVIEDLNRAYAHLSSPHFGTTARSLGDRLIAMGFEALEVAQMLKTSPQQDELDGLDMPLFTPASPTTIFELSKIPDVAILNDDERNQLTITQQDDVILVQVQGNIGANLRKVITTTATGKQKEKLENSIIIHNANIAENASPAQKGAIFPAIPQLCMQIQGELELAETEILLDYYGWNLLDYPAKLECFNLQDDSPAFEIDVVENDHISYHFQQVQQFSFSDDWLDMTENDFVRWLDSQLKLPDVSQVQSQTFLRRLISDLLTRCENLTTLVNQRFNLVREITNLINDYREQAVNLQYQRSLFGDNGDVQICLDTQYQFEFNPNHYLPHPPFYNGRYRFQKAYFAQIEDLKSQGEEYECATIIDSLPQVKYWIRNPVHRGFSLPLAKNNFYPDFIAVLNDDRILIVEYKGEPYKTNDDSKEKCLIGERWEALSNGRCLFIMASKEDEKGRDVRAQLLNKISQ
ncbi:DEAD/DEAH box helicase family protein [Pasteurellaceae bacterium HPA106]|uniref:DEAD/DEAH box helicase n=1 Tax=Spirabiliibacterium pneumoniae TaxID=221400 RepID=UPI001F47BC9D|nr:DEAD/DEAH box helicase family protein [Spirabiliibacterium pneumoniae]MBE2897125.1 DEAD/DEAH box helicase family protein [Spirabiliibacterium pneumoniae]